MSAARPAEMSFHRGPSTRNIEFDTDEGTWMSLDVSPEGKTIIFDLVGQLYVLPITGGTAKKISTGDGFYSQPKYGPQGKIVYVSDVGGAENVWTADADGSSPRQITHEDYDLFVSPAWTADGKSVLVSRQEGEWQTLNLWMYDADSGSSVQLTSFPSERSKPPEERKWVLGPAAAADGRHVYFAQSLKAVSHDTMLPLWQIVKFDLSTKKGTPFLEAPSSAFRPVLSPDGSRLIYGTRHETKTGLRICDLATAESRWLVYPVGRDEQESISPSRDILPGYAFTPDGKYVIAAYGGKIHRIDVRDGRSTIIRFQAKISQPGQTTLKFKSRLSDTPHNIRLIQDPEQSPDGKRLAFSALAQIYIMDFHDGKPRCLTKTSVPEFQPRWSPDGKWIAYVSWTDQGGHIWKALADGQSAPVQLTTVPAYYRELAWAPDGSMLVGLRTPRQVRLQARYPFPSTPLPNTDLIRISSAVGDVNVIGPANGYIRPHFAGTSDRVYVTAPEGLVSFRTDGTDYRQHLEIDDHPRGRFPKQSIDKAIVLAPNGRHALTALGDRLCLVTIPESGAASPDKPLTLDLDSPGEAVITISRVGADYFAWADNGATITWSLGSALFRLPLSNTSIRPTEATVSLEVQPYRPDTAVVLRGARVITMGPAGVITSGDVVIQGNRITSVGPTGKTNAPVGARLIPAHGMTIMPGLIDTHAHFLLLSSILDVAGWNFLASLAYGVTTVRDPQSSNATLLAYQDLLEEDRIAGPRVFTTGPGVLPGSKITSLDDAVAVVRKYKEHYHTDFIKSYVVGNRRQRRWVVEACRELGMMPTTEGASDLKLELTHAIDGFTGNEHSYGTMPLYKDVIELLVRSGIYTTPTLTGGYGGPSGYHYFVQNEQDDARLRRFVPPGFILAGRLPAWFDSKEFIFPQQAAVAKAIVRAGGTVALGTDSTGVPPWFHWAMWAFSNGGFTPLEVLRTATLENASVLGYSQDLGSIESGKLADLVILTKNPLEDIHNTIAIKYVMRNGVLYDAATMDQILPSKIPRPVPWWIADEPPIRKLH